MTRRSSIPVWAALLGSGLAGMLVAVQTRLNGGLSQAIHDPYLTAAISFLLGLSIITIVMLATARGRRGITRLRGELKGGRLPWWALTGGAFGAFFVLGQGLIATVIGLALFTVGVVAGQVLGGLVIDRIGLGPGGRVDPTVQRLVGTALAIVAVVASVFADLTGEQGHGMQIWLVLVPILAGLGTAWQFAVNGLVRAAAQSAVTSTFVSFLVGTVLLLIAAAVSVGRAGWPTTWPSEPWLYVGGIIGTLFIALAAMLVRAAGVLLLSMSNVAGQLVASVALEAGLPLAGGVHAGLLAGAAIALLAVTVAALPSRGSAA